MMKISDIVEATGGELVKGPAGGTCRGVSIDSRKITRGEAFVALRGKRFDGHEFLPQVVGKGVRVVVVQRGKIRCPAGVSVICVRDTRLALGDLARFVRRRFAGPVIAVTGSSGKTTTKEMTAAILRRKYTVLKNAGTQNNDIGVPLTLLRLSPRHDICVVELGTNHFGEIRYLTKICEPTVAVLLNVGAAHLEFLKSPSRVFEEKFDLVRFMRPGGTVIYNRDDPFVRKVETRVSSQRLYGFGQNGEGRFSISGIRVEENRFLHFSFLRRRFRLKSSVTHNAVNAAASILCGRILKIPVRTMQDALKDFVFPPGRQRTFCLHGLTVIDDTYNANPLSFSSAVKTLSERNVRGRKVLVCGDMLELGPRSSHWHRRLGAQIASCDIDLVLTIGREARIVSQTAKGRNPALEARHFHNKGTLMRFLKTCLNRGDAVLVKGSRRIKLEDVVELLKKPLAL